MTDKGLEDLPEGMFAGFDAFCLFSAGSVAVFMVAMVRGNEKKTLFSIRDEHKNRY